MRYYEEMKRILSVVICAAVLCSCSAEIENEIIPEAAPEEHATTAPRERRLIYESDYVGLDNTGAGWGLVRKKGEPPEIPAEQQPENLKWSLPYRI